MISDNNPIEAVYDNEYKFFQKLYKYGSIAGLTVLTAGLGGLALKHFGVPESSELVHKIMECSAPAVLFGGMFTAYFGLPYIGNKILNKRSNDLLKQGNDYSLKDKNSSFSFF